MDQSIKKRRFSKGSLPLYNIQMFLIFQNPDTRFTQVMRQYSWLENDLAGVDRALTPWLVVYGHRPMYCTNNDRDDCTVFETRTRTGLPLTKWWPLEPLLAQYGVDLAVWAHEHSYERLLPTYNRKVVPSQDPAAPYSQPRATVHITTGY